MSTTYEANQQFKLYRKKPVVIEAVKITADNIEILEGLDAIFIPAYEGDIGVETLEGDHKGYIGDWLIRGVERELYICKDSIFKQTYEKEE